jgi:peptidoglycan hydrolase-like protein with peptidoglycan-binding domain
MRASGSDIIFAQRLLHLQPTGVFDELTQAAIRNFQLKNNIPASGNLDTTTKESMFEDEVDLSTDLTDRYSSFIQDYYLPKGEYVEHSTKKEYLFLHHTAGWNNPYNVVDMWGSDTRGRIGTQFVIGGINPRTGDDSYDGIVLKCFDDEFYAWHLGKVDRYMHKHSIGIEICNFGWLVKRGNNFYTYANTKVDQSQVVDLGYTFRGYRYWHRYSDSQIQSLRDLIVYVTETHGISTYLGLQERLGHMSPREAFDYYDEARHGEVKGILSHTSVRSDKFDIFPQENLVDMILSL